MTSTNERIPSSIYLIDFFIYCPLLCEKEGQEERKILYYYPSDINLDRQIRTIGYCEGLVQFTETFGFDDPCETVHFQKTRLLFHKIENDICIAMTLHIPVIERKKDDKLITDYLDENINDRIMLPILKMSYRYFILQHGTMSTIIQQGGIEELRNVLKQYFDKANSMGSQPQKTQKALVIVWAITKLRPYLLGKDFRIETDYCPLCQFHKKRSRNGRLDRWAIEILSEYNIAEIKYKKEKCHCDANLLSRYSLQSNQSYCNDISIRKQHEGYLFPYSDELYDNDSGIQPTASIHVITRSAARANNNQQDNGVKLTSVYNTRLRTTQL
ncbi:unnamed protein product [Rotaria sp. Silwood1]|nr:unnamed protein product [Rotaria sp. Silwood1]